ncbi:MAG: HDIG domain-containing protein [Desulfovibrionaceae bacterium]|nr:HDIG domain-containing protein [Desulfovibrionaceae bacterium]
MQTIKKGISYCKAIMRNGYDAYAINAPLQKYLIEKTQKLEVDIACACDAATLFKILPAAERFDEFGAFAKLTDEDITLYFYPADVEDASHPEHGQMRMTPRLLNSLRILEQDEKYVSNDDAQENEADQFEDLQKEESVRLRGVPSVTLSYNYLLAIRALRFAANYDMPIEPHTWMAIIQSAKRVLDYVPIPKIMDEWKKVSAESMWRFVRLLFDSHILHGLIPELASLACVVHERDDTDTHTVENVFDHTIQVMRLYPTDDLSMDWYGTFAAMFHDIGKLYTAEYTNGQWTFYQHHRVGAGVTRKILRSLHFAPEDIDLICDLVRHHMMFQFMLTDRGIRRFCELKEQKRLIALCRANIEAEDGNYTSFNHNQKYLTRADSPELMLEPLLNGNEIMEYTGLSQGPEVGVLRHALLQAQIAGEVTDRESAIAFVQNKK